MSIPKTPIDLDVLGPIEAFVTNPGQPLYVGGHIGLYVRAGNKLNKEKDLGAYYKSSPDVILADDPSDLVDKYIAIGGIVRNLDDFKVNFKIRISIVQNGLELAHFKPMKNGAGVLKGGATEKFAHVFQFTTTAS
ncbi:MAG: hypothetical protein RhofKO_32160 [Rhodothermales bacterium]